MELRHLRYFVTLAQELHFGRAAERLHISQPPLSHQIRALEIELGAELLERTSRSVALTEAGRLFLPEARATLAQAERAKLVARRAQRGELGELVIAMYPSAPLNEPFAQLVARFRAAYPSALLTLTVLPTHLAAAGLREGKFEVAALRSDGPPPVAPGFSVTELARERLVIAMPADHGLARQDGPLPLAALRDERFVHFPAFRTNAIAHQFTALCRDAGFEPEIAQEANENGTILALVAAGIGVSVLPESVCRLAMPEIRTRPLADAAATTGAWIARPKDPRTPLVRSLLALMPGGPA